MLGEAMITIIFTTVFLGVSLLRPARRPRSDAPVERRVAAHRGRRAEEEAMFEAYLEAWVKGEEQWLKYAWIVPDFPTVSAW